MAETVLQVVDLHKTFQAQGNPFSLTKETVHAVNGVSFRVRKGKTLGVVGESGCGKTTVGRCVTRLYEPDRGHVLIDPTEDVADELERLSRELEDALDGDPSADVTSLRARIAELAAPFDILTRSGRELRELRKRVQIVFQDPWASLNPQMTVQQILSEGPRNYGIASGQKLKTYVGELVERVGLDIDSVNRYPHEFSGGQRQRIGIARALSVQPDLIVCDEPVSALDVSIQAQVLNLLQDLQDELSLSYLFISHDLGVVRYLSDRVAVMYLGFVVEEAATADLFVHQRHPYTETLLESIPKLGGIADENFGKVRGEPPSPLFLPPGCPFAPRCPSVQDRCRTVRPTWTRGSERRDWCHFPNETPSATG